MSIVPFGLSSALSHVTISVVFSRVGSALGSGLSFSLMLNSTNKGVHIIHFFFPMLFADITAHPLPGYCCVVWNVRLPLVSA